MASPAELVVNLGDVVELLDAQVDAGLPRDDVLQSLFNSWTTRLSGAAKLAPKGKAQVTKAIKDGPWDEHQKRDLASIVLGGGQATTTHTRRPTQKLMQPQNFVKQATYVKLRSKLSRASRMSVLATDMRAIGIINPDELTLYKLVQIVAYCEENHDFGQELVWQCMEDLQTFIKAVPRNKDLSYIHFYPATADGLDDVTKRHAYGTDLPVELDMEELASMRNGTKMRGRSQVETTSKTIQSG